jgi:hypothetical protein
MHEHQNICLNWVERVFFPVTRYTEVGFERTDRLQEIFLFRTAAVLGELII